MEEATRAIPTLAEVFADEAHTAVVDSAAAAAAAAGCELLLLRRLRLLLLPPLLLLLLRLRCCGCCSLLLQDVATCWTADPKGDLVVVAGENTEQAKLAH